MKFNPVNSIIAIAISALISYGFYSFNDNLNKVILALGSFLMLGFMLIFVIGLRYGHYAAAINIRVISLVFFTAAFVSSLAFSFIDFTIPAYVIVNGILLLLYILIISSLLRRRNRSDA